MVPFSHHQLHVIVFDSELDHSFVDPWLLLSKQFVVSMCLSHDYDTFSVLSIWWFSCLDFISSDEVSSIAIVENLFSLSRRESPQAIKAAPELKLWTETEAFLRGLNLYNTFASAHTLGPSPCQLVGHTRILTSKWVEKLLNLRHFFLFFPAWKHRAGR